MPDRTPKKTRAPASRAKATRKPHAGENAWRPTFLKWLGSTGNVAFAAQQSGIARSRAYEAKDQDEEFSRAWDEAVEGAVEKLEAKAYSLAMKGDRLMLMFLLKAHRPQMYRERYEKRPEEGQRDIVVDLVEYKQEEDD